MDSSGLEPRFSDALKLRDEQKYQEAELLLRQLADEYPTSGKVWLMLGHVQWKGDGLERAVDSFRRAVELAPRLELASLGLFHALWVANQRDEAFDEMRRFVALAGPSAEYGRLLSELRGESD